MNFALLATVVKVQTQALLDPASLGQKIAAHLPCLIGQCQLNVVCALPQQTHTHTHIHTYTQRECLIVATVRAGSVSESHVAKLEPKPHKLIAPNQMTQKMSDKSCSQLHAHTHRGGGRGGDSG